MEGGEREKERGGERKIVKRRCDSPVSPAVGGCGWWRAAAVGQCGFMQLGNSQ